MFNTFSTFGAMWAGYRIGEGLADIIIDAKEKAKKEKKIEKRKSIIKFIKESPEKRKTFREIVQYLNEDAPRTLGQLNIMVKMGQIKRKKEDINGELMTFYYIN